MTDPVVEDQSAEQPVQEPQGAASDEQLISMLVEHARTQELQLTGEGGLLQQLTKRVLESALEGEITDHVGYDKHDASAVWILRLADPASTWLTGQVLTIDGGLELA
ncbi:hypothetical protein AB0H37_00460 [Actinomadura sp. NPDC023710]|uniref:hypothetical protein n=1 Tax=Actinomadura sp. NPDC023710 TaxID=3158219 RepID=UPI00340D3A0C